MSDHGGAQGAPQPFRSVEGPLVGEPDFEDKGPSKASAYSQLPKHTREMLEMLDREDCAVLIEVLKSYQRAAAIGWFFKWLVAFMVGTFMAAVAFGESIRKTLEWMRGV